MLHALMIGRFALDEDPNFAEGGRHARKFVVTGVWRNERAADRPNWEAGEITPVVVGNGLELAFFDHLTVQDRHRHPRGVDGAERLEIYIVTEGVMEISVWNDADQEEVFAVAAGGSIVVCGGAWHLVHRESPFKAFVATQHPPGVSEKESYITP